MNLTDMRKFPVTLTVSTSFLFFGFLWCVAENTTWNEIFGYWSLVLGSVVQVCQDRFTLLVEQNSLFVLFRRIKTFERVKVLGNVMFCKMFHLNEQINNWHLQIGAQLCYPFSLHTPNTEFSKCMDVTLSAKSQLCYFRDKQLQKYTKLIFVVSFSDHLLVIFVTRPSEDRIT